MRVDAGVPSAEPTAGWHHPAPRYLNLPQVLSGLLTVLLLGGGAFLWFKASASSSDSGGGGSGGGRGDSSDDGDDALAEARRIMDKYK